MSHIFNSSSDIDYLTLKRVLITENDNDNDILININDQFNENNALQFFNMHHFINRFKKKRIQNLNDIINWSHVDLINHVNEFKKI